MMMFGPSTWIQHSHLFSDYLGKKYLIPTLAGIYVMINKAFGLSKQSLFCNVQRDVASLLSYSKLNSKCNHWNSHMLPLLLLIGSC